MNSDSIKTWWVSAGTVLFSLAVFAAIVPLRANHTDASNIQDKGIIVSGHSKVDADPDTASISLGVVTRKKSTKAAVEENAKIADAVIKSVRAQRIADKDIRTTNYSLERWTDYTNKGEVDRGWIARNTVKVTVRDLKRLSAIIDAATQAGANSVQNVSFSVADNNALRKKALSAAIRDARRKAETMANDLGVKLGKPISVQEEYSNEAWNSTQISDEIRVAAKFKRSYTPINPGQLQVTKDVRVTFAIR